MREWKGKVAVVTGGGSGIGQGLCRALAGDGLRVVVADVEAERAEATRAELVSRGAEAIAVRTDVTRRADLEALASQARSAFGAVHVVCNNAGVATGGDLLTGTEAEWRWVLDVNVMGVVQGCQVFAPLLVAQGEGHILNTGSIGSFLASPELCAYTTSKAAVASFTSALREYCAPKGVGVTLLCPGPVATRLATSDRLRPGPREQFRGSAHVLDPVMEMGMEPDQVGALALRGMRENAEYVFTHPEYASMIESRFAPVLRAAAQSAGG
jgi:NAD(P)-dependent dehydrogenase (short-subunit alcohol dehydrogenase family)